MLVAAAAEVAKVAEVALVVILLVVSTSSKNCYFRFNGLQNICSAGSGWII